MENDVCSAFAAANAFPMAGRPAFLSRNAEAGLSNALKLTGRKVIGNPQKN
jgi:hypothetical protein